jgi:hypothetical protein
MVVLEDLTQSVVYVERKCVVRRRDMLGAFTCMRLPGPKKFHTFLLNTPAWFNTSGCSFCAGLADRCTKERHTGQRILPSGCVSPEVQLTQATECPQVIRTSRSLVQHTKHFFVVGLLLVLLSL